MTKPIQFVDLAERHPELYGSGPVEEPEPCPVCGQVACADVHDREERVMPKQPTARRVKQEPTRDPVPTENPERFVVSKQDVWEEYLPPGCITPTNIKRIAKGQQLPVSEAVALGIEWAEEDGPQSFGLAIKDGIPVVVNDDGLNFIEAPIGDTEIVAVDHEIDFDATDPY